MKKLLYVAAVLLFASALYFAVKHTKGAWTGVDESVVEKYAREAGRPPRKPLINTDQGDLLLFCFLSAGTVGGFAGGYYFRALFPPKAQLAEKGEAITTDEGIKRWE